MLDRKFVVENAELVKQNCANRGAKADIDRFLAIEADRKTLQLKIDQLNQQANAVSKSIGQAKDPAERRGAERRRPEAARTGDGVDRSIEIGHGRGGQHSADGSESDASGRADRRRRCGQGNSAGENAAAEV